MKNFIIDTNVLVADPQAMFRFGTNTVIIPMTVIEELDGLKKRSDNVGTSARQVARELDSLREKGGRLHKGVALPSGGTLRVETDIREPTFKVVKKVLADHYILQVALTSIEKGLENVVLVTEDTALRLTADAMGVEAQRYKEIAVENISFYDKTPVIELDPRDFNHLAQYEDALPIPSMDLNTNEYVCVRNAATTNGSLLGRYQETSVEGTAQIVRVYDQEVYGIGGRNIEQRLALHALTDPSLTLVALAGKAGTGKTLLALAAGLEQTIEPRNERYKKLTIARPIVSMGKELGYLPGTLKEKLDPWMAPIYDNIEYLHRGAESKARQQDIRSLIMEQGKVQVEALSYIRGRSMPNQFFIIDECQNLTPHELKTIITRAGEGTKIILTGDPYQIDSPYLDQYSNGLSYVIDAFKGQPMFTSITLHKGERSQLAETASQIL